MHTWSQQCLQRNSSRLKFGVSCWLAKVLQELFQDVELFLALLDLGFDLGFVDGGLFTAVDHCGGAVRWIRPFCFRALYSSMSIRHLTRVRSIATVDVVDVDQVELP